MPSSSRLPHLVRGTSAALIATFAALFSHMLGGGAMPGALGIGVPLVLSLMICVLLAGRALSLPRLSLSVVASQTLFHALFVLGTPRSGASLTSPTSHHGGHGTLLLPEASVQTLPAVQGDLGMWCSHLVGAAVTILFLYRGEQALLRLRALAEKAAAWLRHRLSSPLRLPIPVAPTRMQAVDTAGWTVLAQLQVSSLSRRGPPLAFRTIR